MQLKINACGYEASVLQNLPFFTTHVHIQTKKNQ